MRFMSFAKGAGSGLAVVSGVQAVDIAEVDSTLPASLDALIAEGPQGLERVRRAVAGAGNVRKMPAGSLRARIPLERPGKIICLGLNYVDHAKEGGHEVPGYPAIFMRSRTSLVAHGKAILRPCASERLDYEAELMVVMGRGGRRIRKTEALDHVFGYTCFNDGSVRDYQRKTTQWTPGKNFDRTGPLGPVVVTAEELPAGARGLRIVSRLNGRVLQDGNTAMMVFGVADTIATISEFTTLEPGDLIAMGTPAGVGHARKPPLWLKSGDVIEVEIEGIGVLANPVEDEKPQ